MEIRMLRYFLAVAREENITRAAQSLHISQPSLSKQIMELENEVGKQLLIRGKRKVTLTEEGVLLRKRADEIIALLEKTEHELNADESKISGEITIGGNPTFTVLKAAEKVHAIHPGIHFQFYSSDAIDVLERLEHGVLDFSVFLEPIDTTKYEYISLADISRWGVLLPSDHVLAKKGAIQKEDLVRLPMIFHRRTGLQRLICHWAETGIEKMNIVATYNVTNGSPEKFVKSGLGCYLTTEDLLPSKLDKSVCFCPLDPPLQIHYALIWKRSVVLSKAAKLFLKTIQTI